MHAQPRILLVEDDAPLARIVTRFLVRSGFEVWTCGTGAEVDDALAAHRPDLLILDIMLPDDDGLEICRRVRPEFDGPILMLTARGEDLDEVVGLDAGADDYLAKPVRPQVLLARLRALLRRSARRDAPREVLRAGVVTIDTARRRAQVAGQEIQLTTAEFDLLVLFASRVGQVLTRDELHRELRGVPFDGLDRSVDLRVSRLRRKLGDDSRCPQLLKSVRGTGYLFTGDPP
ncbi:MAG: response regulator transcription factor [Deltaproteobacteria bacterium]|nr:response regulator transcription factor [Deltaproteobacteria bacterium]